MLNFWYLKIIHILHPRYLIISSELHRKYSKNKQKKRSSQRRCSVKKGVVRNFEERLFGITPPLAASKRTGVSVHKTKWLTKWKIDGIDKTNRPS